ncbi:MAG: LptF/LptG family permease [Lentisphaeria bacterium]
MKRLNIYIGSNLLVHVLMAIVILTFVMVSGSLFKAFELLSRGISLGLVGRFLFYMFPYALQFTLPLAILFASVLVFSQLSADNEITAMRASGVSLWQIISPGLVMAAVFSGLCFWLQLDFGPECRYRAHEMKSGDEIENPLAFLEPGRYIQFPNHVVYIGDRDHKRISDVQIYRLNKKGQIIQDIRAVTGRIGYDSVGGALKLSLKDAVMGVLQPQAKTDAGMQRTAAGDMTYTIDFSSQSRAETLNRKPKYMSMRRILSTIYIRKKSGLETTDLYVELNKRISLAFSPIGFFLIGIPFGIRTKRSEASVGIVVGLLLTVVFYVFLALGESLSEHREYHPEILVWIPNIVYQIGGIAALQRISRR